MADAISRRPAPSIILPAEEEKSDISLFAAWIGKKLEKFTERTQSKIVWEIQSIIHREEEELFSLRED